MVQTPLKLWLFLLAVSFLPCPHVLRAQGISKAESITVAIGDFQNRTNFIYLDKLEKSLPQMLKTELSRYPDLTIVEREKLAEILKEQALGQSGIIDQEAAQSVGKLVGAEYVIVGEISSLYSRLRIDVHVIQVVTERVTGEKVSAIDTQHLDLMVALLANNLVYSLTGHGTRREFVQVRRYPVAWLLASTTVSVGTTAMLDHFYRDNYDKYKNASTLDEFDYFHRKANRYYHSRNLMAGVSAALAATTLWLWLRSRSESNRILAWEEPVDQSRPLLAVLIQPKGYRLLVVVPL